jgi:hypothetical protein
MFIRTHRMGRNFYTTAGPPGRWVIRAAMGEPSAPQRLTLTELATKALIAENDPDAVRAGLAEIAEALERLGCD